MPLVSPVLDDLRWDEMVESVRRRIPGASGGHWTHHAPADPGITLLELMAWSIEQRLYWLDQVPDETARALLALLGEAPRPTRAAGTVLVLRDLAGRSYPEIPPAREHVLSAEPPRTFTSPRGTVLAPVASISVTTPAGDRSAELAAGRPVRLFPERGAAAEVEIRLWLAEPLPSPRPTGELTLLFDLAAPPGIEPEWSPDAVPGVAAPAELSWLYRSGPGPAPAVPFPTDPLPDGTERFLDGTGGLRRQGVVRLPFPDDWEPSGPPRDGAHPYSIVIRTDAATFTEPPTLRRLLPGAVLAEHWKRVERSGAETADEARGWLRLPGQGLALAGDEPPPLEDTVELGIDTAGDDLEWRRVLDLAFSGPGDPVFTVDREGRRLRFGDGLTGRIPVPADPDSPAIAIRYRAGGGAIGNLGASRDDRWETRGDADLVASNPLAAVGGAEAETVEEAVERVAGQLRRRHRAVIREDYEELARTTPGVAIARARAAVGHHPDHPCAQVPGAVTVFVVPWAARPDGLAGDWLDPHRVAAPEVDPGALAAVAARLDRARLIGTAVFVRPVRYRPVALAVTLAADPADGDALAERIEERLVRFLDPLEGGERGDGWPFGEPVRPSALVRKVQEAVVREGEVTSVAIGLDGAPPDEDCEDVEIGPHDLVHLEHLDVRYERSATRGGGLP